MKQKKRLIIVYKDLALGGVQKKIIDLLRLLLQRKDLEVFLVLSSSEGEFKSKVPSGVTVIDLKNRKKHFWVLILPFKLAFTFRKIRPDTILAFMDLFGCASLLAMRFLPSRPQLIISQEVHPKYFLQTRRFSAFRKWLVKKFYPSADRIIAVSKAISRDLMETYKISDKKIIFCPNWVTALKSQKGEAPKTIDVIYVGRLASEKNLQKLIFSFSLLLKKIPQAKLCLLGYGQEQENLRNLIEKLQIQDRVHLKSFSHKVSEYLKKSKVFVITSLNEGIPLAMLEAMSLGLPVISTPFPGAQEVIIPGKNGFLADSPAKISEFMYKLLINPRLSAQIGNKGREFIQKKYPPRNLNHFVNCIIGQ